MASPGIPPTARTDRRTLVGVWSQRSVIDYGLARRATLTSLQGAGAVTREDACDAHPYLRLAARHHGEPTGRECPVCRAELVEMAHEHGEFTVYVVEVGRRCGWNHLVRSYVLGDGVDRRVAHGSRRTAYAGSTYGAEG
jgi:hypothetical protein